MPVFTREHWTSLQVVVEPRDGLRMSLLLRPLGLGVVGVAADSESVSNTTEQVDLPGLANLDQSGLRVVAELRRVDGVGF